MLRPDRFPSVFLILVCILTAGDGWTARPYRPALADAVLEPWRWRSFPELKGAGLRCLAEAEDGAIWFGTDEGAWRYDGARWTVYTPENGLLGAPVNVLCAAGDGSIYAGTERGISRFSEGAWRPVFPLEGDLPWPIDDLLEVSDGNVWAGTAWGALHLSRGGPTLYTSDEMGAALRVLAPFVRLSIVPSEATPARFWGEGVGLFVAEGGATGLHRGRAPKVVWAVAPGGPGEEAGVKVGDGILSATGVSPFVLNSDLSRPPGASLTLTVKRKGLMETFEVNLPRRRIEGTVREFSIFDVYEDREGVLWFGLTGGEVARFDIRDAEPGNVGTWRLYTAADGLDIGRDPQIGQTSDGIIWVSSGTGLRGVNRFDGKTWSYFRLKKLGGSNANPSLLETEDGTLWIGGPGALHVHRGRIGGAALQEHPDIWRVYRSPELPIPSYLTRLLVASDGALWIAGLGQEAVRLDCGMSRWTTYQGLHFQCETPDGTMWFLSQDGGIVCYDGEAWTRYDAEDGLMNAPVALIANRDGYLVAAGRNDSTAATARFDGSRWDLRLHPRFSWGIQTGFVMRDGSFWFGAQNLNKQGQTGGVLRFDPSSGPWHSEKAWACYTPPEIPFFLYGIAQTADGDLWFGGNALRRFDGRTWSTVAEPEELSAPWSVVVHSTPKGDLWIGTRTYGAFHYDGKAWARHDVRDGLTDNRIRGVLETDDGSVWVTTVRGVSRFDGQTWVTHALPPELVLNITRSGLQQSRDGALWINRRYPWNRKEGIESWWSTTRYLPDRDPPETEITFSQHEVSQPGNALLVWEGVDAWNATIAEELLYSYRLDGGPWSPFSPRKSQVFPALSSGPHTFEVKARDRDFNEDPSPAVVRFTVIPPVWRQPWFVGLVVLFVGVTGFQVSRIIVRTRERDRAREGLLGELQREFQIAHDMQMGLMPKDHPRIEGFDIAGRCIPANHVGGDYFQYFERDGKLVLAIADVTGKAMEAAIPVVMFSGILKSHMELRGTLRERFERLNRLLHGTLTGRTFVCFEMGELDLSTHAFHLSNAGCPYPYRFRASTGDLAELQVDAYPLGVRRDTEYRVVETKLEPGDRMVFCSDGVTEADNAAGEQFGFGRTEAVIRKACADGLSAEAIIDRILEAVDAFRGDMPQSDDMTCVVVRMA